MRFLEKIVAETQSETKLITTEVYGEAYVRSKKKELSHSVIIEVVGDKALTNVEKSPALCRSVKNIMGDISVWSKDPPTCLRCLTKWEKLVKEHPDYLAWDDLHH